MNTHTLKIANLKCNGCASTITKKISELSGVENVKVDVENDEVTVDYSATQTNLDKIKSTLLGLGYPEATEQNGLLTQLKSYASCMVGRFGN
ncbi:MAG: heavy-metal-associated domain-containing protein [Saprospiraceae bacterium]|nr:heavy-metal-associated domain-containing protein [Saprospiraceae bacterium]MBK7812771.1 heavy-metal-associated domain-containing protein [Saprospiraceae bacterium]MBK9630961.1 heavy-metal-associated domain-containing protein [Saprospiraceae bacterium]